MLVTSASQLDTMRSEHLLAILLLHALGGGVLEVVVVVIGSRFGRRWSLDNFASGSVEVALLGVVMMLCLGLLG